LTFGHTHRGRFLLVILGCWTIGFFGLSRGRFSLVQLLAAAATVLVWSAAGARRRRAEAARERWILSAPARAAHPSNVRRLDAAG
jgi:hypothetical protein